MRKLLVIKLGGSAITDKSRPFKIRYTNLVKAVSEISKLYNKSWRIVVIHGGGSFGHPIAAKYNLGRGGFNGYKLRGFAWTRYWMSYLNLKIINMFLKNNVPAVSLQTSAIAYNSDGKMKSLSLSILEKILEINGVPILYGDVVVDEKLGVSILSGDDLAAEIALRERADTLIYVMGSGGIYNAPPGKVGSKLLSVVTPHTVIYIGSSRGFDVTEGIRRKLRAAFRAAKAGIRVFAGSVENISIMAEGFPGRYTQIRV